METAALDPAPMSEPIVDPSATIFDPNMLITTKIMLHYCSNLAMLPQWDSRPPDEILSYFNVKSISHHKVHQSPEHEFLVIETVNPSNKPYRFILERRLESKPSVVAAEPTYATKLLDKSKKLMHTLTTFVVPESELVSMEAGSSPSYSSSPPFTSDSLSIGDRSMISLVQTSDLLSTSLEKTGLPANDSFRGENSVFTPSYQGQTMEYFKPNHVTLFNIALLADVVHEMYPTYSVVGEQCFFYARVIYTAVKDIFGICPSQSSDEGQPLVYDIDLHLTNAGRYGRWKNLCVSSMDEETVSKVRAAYLLAYRLQAARVIIFF
jgi:hypothetical protein